MKPRIYLAGPDVFAPDATSRFEALKCNCAKRQLEGLAPADTDMGSQPGTGPELAQRIYQANIAQIESCHGVLANLEPFRGSEPDSGTAFEIGYAVARRVPVACVMSKSAGSHAERVIATHGASDCGQYDAEHGWLIENFGLMHNLMLSVSCKLFDNNEAALDWLATQVTTATDGKDSSALDAARHCGLTSL